MRRRRDRDAWLAQPRMRRRGGPTRCLRGRRAWPYDDRPRRGREEWPRRRSEAGREVSLRCSVWRAQRLPCGGASRICTQSGGEPRGPNLAGLRVRWRRTSRARRVRRGREKVGRRRSRAISRFVLQGDCEISLCVCVRARACVRGTAREKKSVEPGWRRRRASAGLGGTLACRVPQRYSYLAKAWLQTFAPMIIGDGYFAPRRAMPSSLSRMRRCKGFPTCLCTLTGPRNCASFCLCHAK